MPGNSKNRTPESFTIPEFLYLVRNYRITVQIDNLFHGQYNSIQKDLGSHPGVCRKGEYYENKINVEIPDYSFISLADRICVAVFNES